MKQSECNRGIVGAYDEPMYQRLTASHLARLPDGTHTVSRAIPVRGDALPRAGAAALEAHRYSTACECVK